VAVLVAVYIGAVASIIGKHRPRPEVKLYKRSMMGIFAFQLLFGFVNLMMHAPVWMQLEHLLIADILWINLVLFAAAALSVEAPAAHLSEAVLQHA
jgi:heme A synthase